MRDSHSVLGRMHALRESAPNLSLATKPRTEPRPERARLPLWNHAPLLPLLSLEELSTADLFKSTCYHRAVTEPSVRTSLDIPVDLHRRLHEAAARKGSSARQLILRSIERAVEESEPKRSERRLSLDPPLVPSNGRKSFDLSNEEIYELLEHP